MAPASDAPKGAVEALASSEAANRSRQGTPAQAGTPADNAASGTAAALGAAGISIGSAGANGNIAAGSNEVDQVAAICAFLRKKGYTRLEQAFKAEVEAEAQRLVPGGGLKPPGAGAAGTPAGAGSSPSGGAAALQGGEPGSFLPANSALPGLQAITMTELAAKNAPRDLNASANGGSSNEVDGAEALAKDPTDTSRGYRMIQNWIEGGLEVYQAELRPLLLPLFIHTYLTLVEGGYGDAATAFYSAFGHAFLPGPQLSLNGRGPDQPGAGGAQPSTSYASLLSQIRSVALPHHLSSDPLVARFRTERYVIKLTQTTFLLLLGWLTDGLGPIAGAGAGAGLGLDDGLDPHKRARSAMLKILNERCTIQGERCARLVSLRHAGASSRKLTNSLPVRTVLQSTPFDVDPSVLDEGVGLTGLGPSYAPARNNKRSAAAAAGQRPHPQYPQLRTEAVTERDAVAEFNARSGGAPGLQPPQTQPPPLKLHPTMPMNDRLQADVQKELELQEWAEKQAEKKKLQQQQAEKTGEAQDGSAEPKEQGQAGVGDVSMTDATAKGKGEDAEPEGLPDIAPAASNGLARAQPEDLLPGPTTFRVVDVDREVAKILDARKALRFDLALESGSGVSGGGLLSGVRDPTFNALGEQGARAARAAAMPSVCAYTFHDADDG